MRGSKVLMLIAAALLASVVTVPLAAQPRPRMQRDRVQLEEEFRQRLASVVRSRLGLNDEQMQRLAEVNQKFEARRRELVRREREVRLALREQLTGADTPSEARVAQLLQETQQIARERLELVEQEQAELAKFLTAVQRAKYLGLQEQMRQRVEQLRGRPPFFDDRPGGPGPGRPGRRPPDR